MNACKSKILCIVYLTIFCNSMYADSSRPILISEKLKNDKSLCIFPSKDLYSLEVLTVCDRPVPNNKNITHYLKYDVSILLCMSLYDVSIMLCEVSKQDPNVKDQIPMIESEFYTLIEKLETLKEYSSLEYFCSAAVHNSSLRERTNSSYETADWINYFNHKLRDEKQCHQVCHSGLDNPNKVHPICSFIMWSNSLYFLSSESELNMKGHEVNKANEEIGNDPEVSKPTSDNQKKQLEEETNPKPIVNNIDIQENILKSENKLNLSVSSPDKESDNANKEVKLESSDTMKVKLEKIEKEMENQNSDKGPSVTSDNKVLPHSQDNQSPNFESEVEQKSKTIVTPGISQKKTDLTTDQKSFGGSDPMTAVTSSLGASGAVAQVPQPKEPEPKEGDIAPVKQADNAMKDIPIDDQDFLRNNEDTGKINDEDTQAQESPLYQDEDDPMTAKENEPPKLEIEEPAKEKSSFIVQDDHFIEAEDSHFFTNFVSLAALCIIAYLVFHNKKKLLALVVEGKRRGPTRRRPNTASYSKLDCNLEEAMVSNTTASVTHVLY